MPQMSHFVLVSCERDCCPNTRRVLEALASFGVNPIMIRMGTIAGMAMRLYGMGQALVSGEGAGTPALLVVDEDTGEKLWAGENPSELEVAQAVYLAGNFA